jgi:cytochrome c biogenesis protein CcmG, thiol:disulfide interchange protein DsbE
MTAARAKLVAQGLALAAVAGLLALLVWSVVRSDGGAAAKLEQGKSTPAPEFTLDLLDGSGELALSELRGKALIVNFWASWCGPCKDEAPFLQRTYERYRSQGLVVLGIDVEDFTKDARRFVKRHGLTYPNVRDVRKETIGKWGVTGYPETFFVDRKGRLVGERIQGGADLDHNEQAFQRGLQLALRGS